MRGHPSDIVPRRTARGARQPTEVAKRTRVGEGAAPFLEMIANAAREALRGVRRGPSEAEKRAERDAEQHRARWDRMPR